MIEEIKINFDSNNILLIKTYTREKFIMHTGYAASTVISVP